VQIAGFARAVLLLHIHGERLPIGPLSLLKLSREPVYHADLVPEHCHGTWFTYGVKELQGCLIGCQGFLIALLQHANRPEMAFGEGYTPPVITLFCTLNGILVCGCCLI